MDLSNYNNLELIALRSEVIKELKRRNILRTNNFLGDLGEYLAIEYYNSTVGLPNLTAAPVSTANIDAIDRNGKRYSIKSTSTNTTGVFYGLQVVDSNVEDDKHFEYVIVCLFSKEYVLKNIYQIDWNGFIKHKKWHSRMSAWNLNITKKFLNDCNKIL